MDGTEKENPKRVPRKPTRLEIGELADAICLQQFAPAPYDEDDWMDAYETVEIAFVAVFDDYISGCPGYSGKLILIAYDGGPEFYECYIQGEKGLMRQPMEVGMANRDCEY